MNAEQLVRWYCAGEKAEALWLLARAALGLTIDHYAERRAYEYIRGLESRGLLAPR